MGKIRAVLRNDEDQVVGPLPKVNTQVVLRGYATSKDDTTVEYIIGGRGSGGGVATTQNINVNMPAMGVPMAPGTSLPAGAIAGPTPGQMTVPGVGSFPYPSVPGVNAPAPATAKQ
jgi:hypothetical protein